MYHYYGCGYGRVWLVNGFSMEGDDVVIQALDRLHDAICLFIIKKSVEQPLLRFVLKNLAASGIHKGPWRARWLNGDILMSFDESKIKTK